MSKLWDEIQKSEEHKDLKYSDVFTIDIHALSDYIYERDSFRNDISILRNRLTVKDSLDYIFKDMDPNNVPLDALYIYLK